MPHTSRKKKPVHKKRKEFVDEEGWTRITSTTSVIGVPRKSTAVDSQTGGFHGRLEVPNVLKPAGVTPRPMKPVKGTTVDTMRAQYNRIEANWLESDLCRSLKEILRRYLGGGRREISNCVVFGSGSFCGDEIHWVDRHESAYYQIAAFRTVADTIEQIQGHWPPCYAQEPFYNELDAAFLANMHITRVDHPQGFNLLDEASFVYSPAAEPEVELRILSHDPEIWLHRSLEHLFYSNGMTVEDGQDDTRIDRDMAQAFLKTQDFAQLPDFDLKNFPFHGSMLWWRKTLDPEEKEP
ncbi:hypothetical protein A1O1_04165 [Capronia coronata CBS 617.96]|uniref:SRR1-like domain-containing protein n=1 Tax=Capronia coronata CBS 617.96 TaxID=1182541 RepID=W9YET9_9EURO|nr:uncharacterized protein A1O1_04165 [Capronia coronata CBS 617.96]EXJ91058.1 hypothetical protein A1O1_04165 [Capronia coronata CBS 617.96]